MNGLLVQGSRFATPSVAALAPAWAHSSSARSVRSKSQADTAEHATAMPYSPSQHATALLGSHLHSMPVLCMSAQSAQFNLLLSAPAAQADSVHTEQVP